MRSELYQNSSMSAENVEIWDQILYVNQGKGKYNVKQTYLRFAALKRFIHQAFTIITEFVFRGKARMCPTCYILIGYFLYFITITC